MSDTTSLREYDVLADRLKLHRQVDHRPIVVVEGPSDERVLRPAISAAGAVAFVASGRVQVLQTAERLVSLNIDRAACVIDRDFDHAVEEAELRGHPVLAYEGADLEGMLLTSPAAIRLVEELSSDEKLKLYGGAVALLSSVRSRAEPISRLRHANAIHSWGVAFDRVDVTNKIDRTTLQLSLSSLCAALASTASHTVSRMQLEQTAESGHLPICSATDVTLVRGRDWLAFVSVALRKTVAGLPKEGTRVDILEAALRAAVGGEWFLATKWNGRLISLLGVGGDRPSPKRTEQAE